MEREKSKLGEIVEREVGKLKHFAMYEGFDGTSMVEDPAGYWLAHHAVRSALGAVAKAVVEEYRVLLQQISEHGLHNARCDGCDLLAHVRALAAPEAGGKPCYIDKTSSRMCERGRKSCIVEHE